MTIEPHIVVELLALGSFTGFLAGLLGIGGSLIMVPFLTWMLARQGVNSAYVVHAAIATSLATIMLSALSSLRAHHRRGAVRWDIVFALTPGILLGAYVGSAISSHLDGRLLGLIFGGFLLFSALQMVANLRPKRVRQLPAAPGMVAAGGAIGSVAGMVGAGGGFLSVPFMTWCNVPIHNAVGTSAALGFPIALAGTVGYVVNGWHTPGMPQYTLGFVYVPALLVIAAASMSLAPLGARVAHSMDTRRLRYAFALLLTVLGTNMIVHSV
ncbi:MAG: sulfite exporter TauE/SafE family protein [Betaproteobacteria bacterium]|nr:sulfite exporter TauE/SafE family protein [Betaproteobacteria bacterium]